MHKTVSAGAARVGRPILGRWHKLVIRVPRNIHMALQINAEDRGITMNEAVNQRLRHELESVGLVNPERKETPHIANSLAAKAMNGVDSKPLEGLNAGEFIT